MFLCNLEAAQMIVDTHKVHQLYYPTLIAVLFKLV